MGAALTGGGRHASNLHVIAGLFYVVGPVAEARRGV